MQMVFHWLIIIALTFGAAAGCSSMCGDSMSPSETDPQRTTTSTVQGFEARFVSVDDQGGIPVTTWYDGRTLHLDAEAFIDDDDVVEMREEVGPDGTEALILRLDDSSSRRLSEITAQNIGRQVALVVGGKVVHSPTIREAINGGVIRVSKCSGLEISQMLELMRSGKLSEQDAE